MQGEACTGLVFVDQAGVGAESGKAGFDRGADCEAKIKEETKATMRCIPLNQPATKGSCVYCGQASSEKGIFGKAY